MCKRSILFRSLRAIHLAPALLPPTPLTCDLMVVGGGSGGIAAAKRAAKHGAKVVLADYVVPTPIGTKWGLGGTCVNVGCIPKKLMHTAGLYGDVVTDTAHHYGWTTGGEAAPPTLDWAVLRKNVTNHIRSLNFAYRGSLMDAGVEYVNGLAVMESPNTVRCANPDTGETHIVTATHVLLATGGRPTYPDIPGASEHGITSDDIFRLERAPKETVIVGAGYIALECAGFLAAFGHKTKILVRSTPLRGFDADAVSRVVAHMKLNGKTEFVLDVPTGVTKDPTSGRLRVTIKGSEAPLECDTVLFAMGRNPKTNGIGLDKVGVALHPTTRKVIVDGEDRSSVGNVFAVGDIAEGGLELTPVAVRQGELLADRLFASQTKRMAYHHVATTIFTPLEYGCVGLTEQQAEEKFGGGGNIEVYHTGIWPLEWTVPHLPNDLCYLKVITAPPGGAGRVVGWHIVSPNAGEITQGVAMAMVAGLTKEHMDDTVGIHPTVAESFTKLVKKKEQPSATAPGC